MAQTAHQCQIVNNTNTTVILKIVGHEPTSNYTPDLPGVNTGLLFALPPLNQDLRSLAAGKRVVILWSSDGSRLLRTHNIDLTAPATIVINLNSATQTYSVDATGAGGQDLSI